MESIWNGIEKQEFLQQQEEIKTDVLIIGGGMSGLLCAYMLQKEGVDCVLVEADKLCAGVTNGTTAKITAQHGLIYDKISKNYGDEKAKQYYKSQKEAMDKLINLAKENDADVSVCDSYVYALNNRKALEKETAALEKTGCRVKFCEDTELPFRVSGAIRMENQAKFHPLKFAYGISRNLKIYENTKVRELRAGEAITDKGKIKAEKIIVATHFPFINMHGGYFLKMYQHRSYVLALRNAPRIRGMYVDEGKKGLSFRTHGEVLLLGGGSHRTGSKGGNWEELSRFAKKYYPEAQETARWATQDCMTLDSIPYIGRYAKTTKDIYVATGFNKWGMTSSMVSAMLLTDLICGRKNEYEALYSPQRTMLHPQLVMNVLESAKGLITPKTPRCPHMGCALQYNKQEHSWDCPCHGSRFKEDGTLINNPATADKKM